MIKDKNKLLKSEVDWFDDKGKLVILNNKALRKLKKGENLKSYGKISLIPKKYLRIKGVKW